MARSFFVVPFLLSTLVAGHGYMKSVTIDGITYPGYIPMISAGFPEVKSVVWAASKQNTFGVGPVVDVDSPDIACRAGVTPAEITAVARAGSQMKFQWSQYFTSHKGPVITYMARSGDAGAKPQDLEFFKIDQSTYDPKTYTFGSDVLIKQNNSWTVTIPSDLKAGKYVVRHELIALQFGGLGNSSGAGTGKSGAQFYPICVSVQVLGSGSAMPVGVKFPGGYKPSDPGILYNLYDGPNAYAPPGPPVYLGVHNPPEGPAPVVTDTGIPASSAEIYAMTAATAEEIFNNIAIPINKALPGGGGCHSEVDSKGQPIPGSEKCFPLNNGQSLDMLNAPIVSGDFPGGPNYKGKDAPAIEPTDLAMLLTPKGPVNLGDFVELPLIAKAAPKGSVKKMRRVVKW